MKDNVQPYLKKNENVPDLVKFILIIIIIIITGNLSPKYKKLSTFGRVTIIALMMSANSLAVSIFCHAVDHQSKFRE